MAAYLEPDCTHWYPPDELTRYITSQAIRAEREVKAQFTTTLCPSQIQTTLRPKGHTAQTWQSQDSHLLVQHALFFPLHFPRLKIPEPNYQWRKLSKDQ